MSLTKYRYIIEQVGDGYCLDKVADKVNGIFYLCTEVDAVIADLLNKSAKEAEQLTRRQQISHLAVQEAQDTINELKDQIKWLEEAAQKYTDRFCKLNTEIYEWENKPLTTHFKACISRLFTHQR